MVSFFLLQFVIVKIFLNSNLLSLKNWSYFSFNHSIVFLKLCFNFSGSVHNSCFDSRNYTFPLSVFILVFLNELCKDERPALSFWWWPAASADFQFIEDAFVHHMVFQNSLNSLLILDLRLRGFGLFIWLIGNCDQKVEENNIHQKHLSKPNDPN